MKFNEKLQKLRRDKGMSQENLSEILDVSRQAISKWESGHSYPEMEKLIILSDLFGVTLDSLVKDSNIQNDHENTVSEPFWFNRGTYYEYTSRKTLFGLPMVHINIGRGFKKAKGIIAIGNISTGIISIGLLSRGLISLGVLSIGIFGIGAFTLGILLAIGSVSVGIFSIGAVSIGVFTLGALSIGMFSIGACAIASHIAIGDYANGHIAVGRIAKGAKTFIDNSPGHDFSLIKSGDVKEAIYTEFPKMLRWIVNLMTCMFR